MAEQVAPDTGHPPMEWTRVSATLASGQQQRGNLGLGPGAPGLVAGAGQGTGQGVYGGCGRRPQGGTGPRRWKASCDSFAIMSAPPGLWS